MISWCWWGRKGKDQLFFKVGHRLLGRTKLEELGQSQTQATFLGSMCWGSMRSQQPFSSVASACYSKGGGAMWTSLRICLQREKSEHRVCKGVWMMNRVAEHGALCLVVKHRKEQRKGVWGRDLLGKDGQTCARKLLGQRCWQNYSILTLSFRKAWTVVRIYVVSSQYSCGTRLF